MESITTCNSGLSVSKYRNLPAHCNR